MEEGEMYKAAKSKKPRKVVWQISPIIIIKENVRKKVLEQLLANLEKFKAFPLDNETVEHGVGHEIYSIELRLLYSKRRVLEIVKKFNFEVIFQQ